MRTLKVVIISFGVTLYSIITFALLSHVYWRSACDTCKLEETACALHRAAAGLFLSVVGTCFLVPAFFVLWLRCIPFFKQWSYTCFGAFLVSNATVVTAASTIVIIVEQFMCPRDKSVEFAAIVLIFVVQTFTGIIVEEIYLAQGESKRNRRSYHESLQHPVSLYEEGSETEI